MFRSPRLGEPNRLTWLGEFHFMLLAPARRGQATRRTKRALEWPERGGWCGKPRIATGRRGRASRDWAIGRRGAAAAETWAKYKCWASLGLFVPSLRFHALSVGYWILEARCHLYVRPYNDNVRSMWLRSGMTDFTVPRCSAGSSSAIARRRPRHDIVVVAKAC